MNENQEFIGRFQCVAIGDAIRFVILDTQTGDWKIYTARYDPVQCLSLGKFETDELLLEKIRR